MPAAMFEDAIGNGDRAVLGFSNAEGFLKNQ